MRKIIALALAMVMLFGIASAEGVIAPDTGSTTATTDATYKTLYENIYRGLSTDEDSQTDSQLKINVATVWKINDALAGFMFKGADWMLYGEAEMTTGLVKNVFCKLPYNNAGILMTYMVAFTLSGLTSTDEFIKTYIGSDTLLNGTPFPDYKNILDAGNDQYMVYEFERSGEYVLYNAENACDMSGLIASLQK